MADSNPEERTIGQLIEVADLGRLGYASGWNASAQNTSRVLANREADRRPLASILVVEHDPVLTVSSRPSARENIIVGPERLNAPGSRSTRRTAAVTSHTTGRVRSWSTRSSISTVSAQPARVHACLRKRSSGPVSRSGSTRIEKMARRESGFLERPSGPTGEDLRDGRACDAG